MFVCVTEILDTFGELVWDRLRRKTVLPDPLTGKPRAFLPGTLFAHFIFVWMLLVVLCVLLPAYVVVVCLCVCCGR